MASALFDNLPWHALTGAQSRFATGSGAVRRFVDGFAPFAGFEDPGDPDFGALQALCAPGSPVFAIDGPDVPPPPWKKAMEMKGLRMVWNGAAPGNDEAPEARRLTTADLDQVLPLVALTQPGPFGPRTIELGDYFGIFEGGRLAAMAGERMHAGTLREVSGICTHPDFRGRGLARKLMLKLMALEMARGETPFLHVMADNTPARALYDGMGFRVQGELFFRVLVRE